MSLAVMRRVVFTLALGALPVSMASAADVAATDRLLPPNVLLYFSVPDCLSAGERFSETDFGKMVNDEAMADVRAEIMKKFNEASDEAEKEIGMPLSDLLAIPTGEAAFALVQPPGQKLGGVMFLDVGEHLDQLNTLLEKAEKGIEEEGKLTRGSDEFEGTEITVWTNPEAGPNDPVTGFAWFVKDSMFVAATTVDLLEAALVRWDGQHDRTFATSETYQYILDRCDLGGDQTPAFTWYFDPLGLFKAGMAAAGPEVGMQGAMVMGFLPVLGLDRLKGMGGVMDLATPEYNGVAQTLIYVEQPVTGVLRALVFPAIKQSPPEFIPAETSSISGMNWDVQGAYSAVEQVYDFFTAPGTFSQMMDEAAEAENGPGLHPKDDFLDLLSGQIFLIQNLAQAEDLQQQKMAFLFGLNNEARMQEVVAKLTSMEGVDVSIREFNGTKIYEAENPPAGQPVSPAAAVSNGYLMFAVNVELLETLLRGNGGESLAESAEYKLVSDSFPAEVSTFSFQRQDKLVGAVYESLKTSLAGQEEFDVGTLPDFEAIRKYFGAAGSYSIPDEKGVFMSSFSIRAKE